MSDNHWQGIDNRMGGENFCKIKKIYAVNTNEETDALLDELDSTPSHAGICDLIFQNLSNPTPEQALEKALQIEVQHTSEATFSLRLPRR